MKLRTVTIWTTGLMSLLTLFVPIMLFVYGLWAAIIDAEYVGHAVYDWYTSDVEYCEYTKFEQCSLLLMIILMFWVCSCLPMVFSYFIARKLKCISTTVIILCPATVYIFYYVYWLFQMLYIDALAFFRVMFAGMVLAPVMIPAWFIALILDSYYERKSASDPGTSRRDGLLAAPSLALLEGENVVE